MTLALQINEADIRTIENYVARRRLNISDFIRQTVLQKIESENAREAKEERNAAYLAKLKRADEQIKAGQVVVKTMEELEAMAE